MQPQRIILAGGSRFLRELLRKVIAKTPGLILVGEVADLTHLQSELQQTDVDWIVISPQPHNPIANEVRLALLEEFPSTRILGFCIDGDPIRIFQVGQPERIYHELTLQNLRDILRGNRQN